MEIRWIRVSLFALLLASLVFSFLFTAPVVAEESDHRSKVVGGYFEEWSIYFANYNIANLQVNGVADKLTHLTYAFGGTTSTGCSIADSWADYLSPYLPSVSDAPYTGPLFGNFAALQQLKQLHPNLKELISLADGSNFSAAASTESSRQAFVASCVDLFINGNVAPGISAAGVFDGIDIDWECRNSANNSTHSAGACALGLHGTIAALPTMHSELPRRHGACNLARGGSSIR